MKRAFTLIELSIVLIIIGLLVGGVLTGRDLIKQAQLRSLGNDFVSYDLALNTYQLKYDAKPGDHESAQDFFGGGVNDGNGDNVVLGILEILGMVEHLAEAGLVEGSYTGELAGGGVSYQAGVNLQTATFDGSMYFPGNMGNVWPPEAFGRTGREVALFLSKASHNFPAPSAADLGLYELDIVDTISLDTKMDDGRAESGKFIAAFCNADNEIFDGTRNLAPIVNAEYDLGSTSPCHVGYVLD